MPLIGNAPGGSQLQNPTVWVQVAFDSNLTSAPVAWTTITSAVQDFRTNGGRQHQLDRPQASTFQATLDDRGGDFTPWNSSSPYAGSLEPGKAVRVIAQYGDQPAQPLFYGYVDAWTPTPADELNTNTILTATDVLKLLALRNLDNGDLYQNLVLSGTSAGTPVVYYRMGDPIASAQVQDSSGNSYTGSVHGGVAFGQAGALLYDNDTAADFSNGGSGPSGYVSSSCPFGELSKAGQLSVAMWVKASKGNLNLAILAALGAAPSDFVFELGGDFTGRPGVAGSVVISDTVSGVSPVIDDGSWHFLVATLTPDPDFKVNLYVDGHLRLSGDRNPFTGANAGLPVLIGAYMNSTTGLPVADAACTIDEVALYGRALSPQDVLEMFTVGNYFRSVESTGERLQVCLTVAGYDGLFPTDIATGTVTCGPETSSVTSTSALSYIQSIEDTEDGLIYQQPDGTFTFRDSQYCYTNPTSTTSQAVIGDNDSTPHHYIIDTFQLLQDDLDLWSDVQAQSNNGLLQEAYDLDAVNNYGWRTLSRTSLLTYRDRDVLAMAQWLLSLFKDPSPRPARWELSSAVNGGADIPLQLGLGFWDRVTIQRQPPGSSQYSADSVIESIAHTWQSNPGELRTQFVSSPFEIAVEDIFVLDVSELDQGRLGL